MEIRDWGHMKQFGLSHMTGEACALGMRQLIEVDDGGEKLLNDFFNVYQIRLHSFGSAKTIMLPRTIFKELASFALLTMTDVVEVWDVDYYVKGIENEYTELYARMWEEAMQRDDRQSPFGRINGRWRRNRFNQPCNEQGTVHRHQMLGVCP